MARLRNIVHSDDACTMIFEGNPKKPEPSCGIIKFPNGHVEVSRCSDGSYYAHIVADEADLVIDSRIEYDHDGYLEHGVPEIPAQEHVKKLAIKIKGITWI